MCEIFVSKKSDEIVSPTSIDSQIVLSTPPSSSSSSEVSLATPDEIVSSLKSDGVTFSLSSVEAVPGDVLVINAQNVEVASSILVETDLGVTPQFFKSGDHLSALIPLSYDLGVGT